MAHSLTLLTCVLGEYMVHKSNVEIFQKYLQILKIHLFFLNLYTGIVILTKKLVKVLFGEQIVNYLLIIACIILQIRK